MIFICKPNRVTRSYLGGHRIDALRGIEAADNYKPEEWVGSVTSARNPDGDPREGLSVTTSGEYFAEILKSHPEYLGKCQEMPILLKLLDASERLVIQVHPTVDFARKNLNSPFGKAECWYIIAADPGACVYLGFRESVTREDWKVSFQSQSVERMLSMLHKIELSPGDVWYVDGGVPHAIGGGCLMAELQEPTDLMTVVEKVTPSGRKIPDERLHCGLGFDRMFDMFEYKSYSRTELEAKFHRHIEVPKNGLENRVVSVIGPDLTGKFAMDEYRVNGRISLNPDSLPHIFVVISGSGEISDTDSRNVLVSGDCGFIPASVGSVTFSGNLRVLVCHP